MYIWKSQLEDLPLLKELCYQSGEEISGDELINQLSTPDTPFGIYLISDGGAPLMGILIKPWRKVLRITAVWSVLPEDSVDFTYYFIQFISDFVHKNNITGCSNQGLFCFTRSEFVLKAALNSGFEIYTELLEYTKRDDDISEVTGMPVMIRPVKHSDIGQLINLEKGCFMPEFWNDWEIFISMIERKNSNFVIAEVMNQVVGYVFTNMREPDSGHLVRLAVHVDYQGLGIGRQLLARGIRQLQRNGAQQIFLFVRGENIQARALYEQFGFVREDFEYLLRYEGGIRR